MIGLGVLSDMGGNRFLGTMMGISGMDLIRNSMGHGNGELLVSSLGDPIGNGESMWNRWDDLVESGWDPFPGMW